MRWIDIIRIALRMLTTHRLRTGLTAVGIGMAIALIIILTGIGYGVQEITIGSIVKSKQLLSLDVFSDGENTVQLTEETIKTIDEQPATSEFSRVFGIEGQIEHQGQLVSNSLQAVDLAYFSIEGFGVEKGKLFTQGQNEIIVSPQTLELMNTPAEKMLGQKVMLRIINPDSENELLEFDMPFTIVGVTNGTDSSSIFIPYDQLQSIMTPQMTSIKVLARDRDSVTTLDRLLKDKGYVVETLLDTLDAARRVFKGVTIVLVVIAFIALIVAAVGMFNTLTITLLERTREIGIMKAIGATDSSVKRLFLTEAMVIGLLGGLLGVGLGLLGSQIINQIFNQFADYYGAEPLQIYRYPSGFITSMIIYPTILGIVTGFYPAIRASKFNPLDALRYE